MSRSTEKLSRRAFLCGTGAAVGATMMTVASALASETEGATFDESYDVVVVGFGFAGSVSATYAADAGAHVLLVDVAPEGEEGGNSRFCAQIAVTGTDQQKLYDYYVGLGGHMNQDLELLEAYTAGMLETPDIMRRMGAEEPVVWSEHAATAEDGDAIKALYPAFCPEYPELDGANGVDAATVHAGMFDSAFYQLAHETVLSNDQIDVWLESPARHLVCDTTGRVVGVVVEHEGSEVRVEARSGVVLACGGFECNDQMKQDYLGCERLAPMGGMHNNGDGIRMAQEIGADLWHMNVYESLGMMGGNNFEVPAGERVIYISHSKFLPCVHGALICVAEDGSRYLREDGADRHGHVYSHGTWHIPNTSYRPHLVFDEAQKALIEEKGLMPANVDDVLVEAGTAEELAGLIDADPEILATTIERFNGYAESGVDLEYGRAAETMRAFEGKLYALPLQPCVLNTQGGPRRNANAQVMHVNGEPIPGLFSAGECGGCSSHYYQGGGNVAECLIFGRIAGTNAANGLA